MRINNALVSLLIYILLIVLGFQYLSLASEKRQINSGLLKYDRQKAVKYAMDYWNWTAPGYFNFGSKIEDPDREDEEFPVILDNRDCAFYNVQKGYQENGEPDCAGDCANFVCQCLIAGGIPAKKLVNGASKVEYRQINPTILTASCLTDQLSKMGVYDSINNKILRNDTSGFTLSDLDIGDVGVFNNPFTHSAIIGERGNDEATVGVYAHSLSRYPSAKNYKGKIGYYFKSFSYNYLLFHIPDVPVIKDVEIFQNNADGSKKLFYKASLDDNANNGDGAIVPERNKRVLDTINPIFEKDKIINLKIRFNLPVKIDHKEHKVQLVKYKTGNVTETDKKSNNNDTSQAQTEDIVIELSKPSLSSDKKTIEYLLPITNVQLINNPGEWTIKVRTFADSDETPLNGAGTYEKYKDEPDINHFLIIYKVPQLVVKDCEIGKLHLPLIFQGEEPPGEANLQPLRSDGAIPLDWKKIGYLYSRCVALPAWEKVSCTTDATMQAMKKLTPTYYIGPEILSASALSAPVLVPAGAAGASSASPFAAAASIAASPPAPEPIVLDHYDGDNHSLETGLQPVYTALVQTIDENKNDGLVPRIEPLAKSGSFRDEVKLWLDVNPIEPRDEKGYNTVSPSAKSVDISNLYDIYLFKDSPDQALIALPLKRLYESAEGKSLPDGAHTLRIETSLKNDEDAAKKGYESLVTLKYIKDFKEGENAGNLGNSTASTVRDDGSGFSNRLLNY